MTLEEARYPRIAASDVRSRVAVATARAVSRGARLWRQRGLGTVFLKLNSLRAFQGTECITEFEPNCRFRLPVFEPFWGPTVIGGRPYEPEVVHLLRKLRDLSPTFVDCGANWGYYSVLVTGPSFGYAGGIALEANPTTFERLRENSRLNGDRFTCLQYAVGAESGKRVRLSHTEHHAITQVSTEERDAQGIEVETITLDDALERVNLGTGVRLVLKVDVEGQEIPALEGARRLRSETDHVIVYEDWTSLGYPTTSYLFNEGYALFYVRTDGRCVELSRLEDAYGVIAADGRVSRPCNFVAAKRGGVFFGRLTAWSSSPHASAAD
jgi:FkbM family methyltransferase